MSTYGKTIAKIEIDQDRKKLVLTDTEGETYTFKHDHRLPGSGIIIGIDGDLNSLIGSRLFYTTLRSEKGDENNPARYAWVFHRIIDWHYDGLSSEWLATVWWSGEASGYYGGRLLTVSIG